MLPFVFVLFLDDLLGGRGGRGGSFCTSSTDTFHQYFCNLIAKGIGLVSDLQFILNFIIN